MQNLSTVELTRDCEVVQIPHGTSVVLAKGTSVDITQTLGGSYTIRSQGALFRVPGKDADALGLELISPSTETTAATATAPEELSEDQIWETLRSCFDPEIPVNIVDLGLVYSMELKKLPAGSYRVDVKMTLTAPGCGMGPSLAADAEQRILSVAGVASARVELVWDPPWSPERISPAGRETLGME